LVIKERKTEEATSSGSSVFEFLDVCDHLEKEVLNESTKLHDSLVDQLNSWLSETDSVLAAVDETLGALNRLKVRHRRDCTSSR